MIISIASGKGGTGKTSLMAAFASLSNGKVICDADVDAADLHLVMDPEIKTRQTFESGNTAIIDTAKCTACGMCRELCRWDAISDQFRIDPISCEGCGVCVYFCPEDAIDFPVDSCGEWFISDTRFGPLVYASLGIAEENSGKLVTLVRKEARRLAEEKNLDLILTDGPPAIGCPVIASIGGASALLIVTEPTVSGKHDMERVCRLAAHFNVPAMVCVNKFDLNLENTHAIEVFAKNNMLRILGRIPFDPVFTDAMTQGQTIFEYNAETNACRAVQQVWEKIETALMV